MNKEKEKWIIMITLSLAIVLLINSINIVQAACIIQGYSLDKDGNAVSSEVIGYCKSTGENISFKKNPGVLWSVAFGGPFETCSQRCEEVTIDSTSEENGGMFGELILNADNTPGWDERDTKKINITLLEVDQPEEPKKKRGGGGGGPGPIVIPQVNNTEPVQPVIVTPVESTPENVTSVTEEKDINNPPPSSTEDNTGGINPITIIIIGLMVGICGFIVYKIIKRKDRWYEK